MSGVYRGLLGVSWARGAAVDERRGRVGGVSASGKLGIGVVTWRKYIPVDGKPVSGSRACTKLQLLPPYLQNISYASNIEW